MKHSVTALMAVLILACGASSDTGINKDLKVGDGERRSNGMRSVNGSISIGNGAVVEGDCSTVNGQILVGESSTVEELSCVNGSIELDRNAKAKEVSCVNGSIKLGSEVSVEGDVSTVNGSIHTKAFAHVTGDLSTVNGDMVTNESVITGDISTVNGDIDLHEKSIIKGNIVVDRNQRKRWSNGYKKLTITVDSGSKVNGNIEVKGDDANVTVVLASGGEVLGEIINAEVVRK